MTRRFLAMLLALAALAACDRVETPALEPLPRPAGGDGSATAPISLGAAAPARLNGRVGGGDAGFTPRTSYGSDTTVVARAPNGTSAGGGDVSLDFADTDIREVTAQILGGLLHQTYTIDPSVHGTATLRTATPIARSQLLPTLEALLEQNGATLLQDGALIRIVPAAAAVGPAIAGGPSAAGSVVVPLRYAGAEDLARVLQPYVGPGGRVVPDAGRNVLLVSGEPSAREALLNLIQAFDIDLLSGQSYALLPVTSGDAKDFSTAMLTALRGQTGGALATQLRIIPMERLNAVMVVANTRRLIDGARRVYDLVDAARRDTVRSWHVYYLQNSSANDAAYVLQEAFTPNDVTASAPGSAQATNGAATGQLGGAGIGGQRAGALGGAGAAGNGLGGSTTSGSFGAQAGATAAAAAAPAAPPPAAGGQAAAAANPLLGGLDAGAGGAADTNALRIIPNSQNHALLVYATRREEDTIEAMLRKIDILPLEVQIDATIAEVTLNDQLQYGTQFFFKSGGINAALNNSTTASTASGITSAALATAFPGFIVGGRGAGGAPFALSALQAVTKVQVLSSPQILVLDGQAARLQVGNLVPYLTSSSQSTITSNAPVINSINYQPTGVIMQVTPRVNTGGLVTIDINQEVSGVDTATNASGIASPTFTERSVSSRVVVQDGETIGLAGLISDNVSRGNSGLPWLKDIPLLGVFGGTQDNTRDRTELLVLLTPHVVHDQRDARALTEDLRERLSNAAAAPADIRTLPLSGSTDPNRPVRKQFGVDN